MKTKIYNNLIFSLLFVCSIVCVTVPTFAQNQLDAAETAPTTTSKSITKGDPTILNLYSSIWGAERINTTDASQEAVSGLIQKFFTRFFRVIFTVSGILMVVMLAVHGTQMIYAEFTGNVSGFSDAKKRVVAAAVGTIILLLSWIILDFIDPSLLRPQLFKTITQLREVGQGNNLVTTNLTVPDKAVNYDKETGILTISACPDIEDNFKGQAESVRQSLQTGNWHEPGLQDHYQILYSDFGGKVRVYEKDRPDRTFDELKTLSGGDGSLVGVIPCTGSEIEANIKSDSGNIPDIIAVFPVVSITVKKTEDAPGKVAKFWRGKPWRYKPKIDADDCIALGKDHIKLKGSITAEPLYDSNNEETRKMINNQHGGIAIINFPAIEKSGRIFNSIEGAVTGYHIDNKDVKHCTVTKDAAGKGCSINGGTYESASKSTEIEFKITSGTAGRRLVAVGKGVKHEGVFRITPMLVPVNERGQKIGQCKEPLRGETACFQITRIGGNGNVFGIGPAPAGCLDTSISRDSTKSQKDLSEYAESKVKYTAGVTAAKSVALDEPLHGYSYTYFTFSDVDATGWDKDEVEWGNPFDRGRRSIELKITEGAAFFERKNILVGTIIRGNWQKSSIITEVVYFKGTPPRFCITPTLVKGDRRYELENKCHKPPPANQ